MTQELYDEISCLNYEQRENIRIKVVEKLDRNAAFLWTAFSVFKKLNKELARNPTLQEINDALNFFDDIEIKYSFWTKIKRFFKRKK